MIILAVKIKNWLYTIITHIEIKIKLRGVVFGYIFKEMNF